MKRLELYSAGVIAQEGATYPMALGCTTEHPEPRYEDWVLEEIEPAPEDDELQLHPIRFRNVATGAVVVLQEAESGHLYILEDGEWRGLVALFDRKRMPSNLVYDYHCESEEKKGEESK